MSESLPTDAEVAAASAAAAADKAASPPATCACNRIIRSSRWKCKRCHVLYCSQACRSDFKRKHRETCTRDTIFNQFWAANHHYLKIIGTWLKVHPEHNFVGMHIAIPVDPEKECKITPIDEKQLTQLQKGLAGSAPDMQSQGYPDYLAIIFDTEMGRMAIETDLVCAGRILCAQSPLFNMQSLHKFVVPVAAALRGEKRNEWQTKEIRFGTITRSWQNFAQWRAMQAR
jgi:hypothetical protein